MTHGYIQMGGEKCENKKQGSSSLCYKEGKVRLSWLGVHRRHKSQKPSRPSNDKSGGRQGPPQLSCSADRGTVLIYTVSVTC